MLLLPVLVLGLAACGSDEPSGPDPKAAYLEQAAAICDGAEKELGALMAPGSPAGFGPYAEATVAIAEKAQKELAALTLPEKDRAAPQSKVLDPFAAVIVEGKAFVGKAFVGKAFVGKVKAAGSDQAQLLPLLSQVPTTDGIDKDYLRSYGLGGCADAITLQPG